MKVPENPYRKALAGMYIEKIMGRPEEEDIKKAVNLDENDGSLDYYIGTERMINNTIQVFRKTDEKELKGAGNIFSAMLFYVSYQIERLISIKDKD